MQIKKFLFLSLTPLIVSTTFLISCSKRESNHDIQIPNFRENQTFFGHQNEALDKKKIGITVIGNRFSPVLNVNHFIHSGSAFDNLIKDDTSVETIGTSIKNIFLDIKRQKLKFFHEETHGISTKKFINLIKNSDLTPLGESLKKSEVIIVKLGTQDLFEIFKGAFNFSLTSIPSQLLKIFNNAFENKLLDREELKEKYKVFRSKVLTGLKNFKTNYLELVKLLKTINPKASIVLLGMPMIQQKNLSLNFQELIKILLDKEEDNIVEEIFGSLNSTIKEVAAKNDSSFVYFDPRNIKVVKSGIYDSVFSFGSKKFLREANFQFAKLVFLKLSTPNSILERVLKQKDYKKEEVDKILLDYRQWLGVNYDEEEDLREFQKVFYFSPKEEKLIRNKIVNKKLAGEKLTEEEINPEFIKEYVSEFLSLFLGKDFIQQIVENSLFKKYSEIFANYLKIIVTNKQFANLFSFYQILNLFINTFKNLIKELSSEKKDQLRELINKIFNVVKEDFREAIERVKQEWRHIQQHTHSVTKMLEDVGNKVVLSSKVLKETLQKYKSFLLESVDLLLEMLPNLHQQLTKIPVVKIKLQTLQEFLLKIKGKIQKFEI